MQRARLYIIFIVILGMISIHSAEALEFERTGVQGPRRLDFEGHVGGSPVDSLQAGANQGQGVQEKGSRMAFTLQYRPRSEYRNGYKKPMSDSLTPAFITNQRSRIGLTYSTSHFRSRVSFQDVRTWGESRIKRDISTFLLHEAWFEWYLSSSFSVKVGRQVLKYDEQRLLAACNWNNVGSTHDMALLQYEKPDYHLHLGMAYNNDRNKLSESYYDFASSYYKALQFFSASRQFSDQLEVSLLEIADGHQQPTGSGLYWRLTTGINVDYHSDNDRLKLMGKSYWQGGQNQHGRQIRAYFWALKASYALGDFRVIAGMDYFSGDNQLDTTDQTVNAFNNLYGSGHGYYGSMDYFTTIDQHTNGGGLRDIHLGLSYTFNHGLSARITYHHFALSGKVRDPAYQGPEPRALDASLGSEIDFSLKYHFSDEFSLKAGYSAMVAIDNLCAIKGGDPNQPANWGFVMLQFNPQIFINSFIQKNSQ